MKTSERKYRVCQKSHLDVTCSVHTCTILNMGYPLEQLIGVIQPYKNGQYLRNTYGKIPISLSVENWEELGCTETIAIAKPIDCILNKHLYLGPYKL